jgi:hypothetical protein
MHIDERLSKIESDLAALAEALYSRSILPRPEPPKVELPSARAENIKFHNPYAISPGAVDLGLNVTFEYPCGNCGEFHKVSLENIRGFLPNTTRSHKHVCPHGDDYATRVVVHRAKDESSNLLESALSDLIS